MKLEYKRINMNNVKAAAKIQYEIFPNSSAYFYYLNNMPKTGLPFNWLIYYENKPIGIIGLHATDTSSDTIWLSWFGILKQYRRKGLGRKIFQKIKEEAAKYQKPFLRLYTYEVWNKEAQPFYDKVMEICEYYTNEKENQFNIQHGKPKIYGISLSDKKIDYWNNKFINITKDDELHIKSVELLKRDGIIK